MNEASELDRRVAAFRGAMDGEAKKAMRTARRYEHAANGLFYAAMIGGGLAVLGGLVSSEILKVAPWAISVCAAVGTGASFLAREAKYRSVASCFYAIHDTARAYGYRLEYETEIPITRESLAAIAKEWREADASIRMRLSAVKNTQSEKMSRK